MIDTIVVLLVLLHLLAYYSEEVWGIGNLVGWETGNAYDVPTT
jgi:hypothetical protein